MVRPIHDEIESGPFPYSDGWGWLYHAFERIAPAGRLLRRVLCRYFYPCVIERWRGGLVYKLLGVHMFGALIPTGGIVVRRVTKARMAPYTLVGNSLGAARAFYYRTCVFEALHLPFFLTLVALALHRAAIGRPDLALENTAINLLVNVYPVMHHRRTRTRISHLLDRSGSPTRHPKRGLAG
ncbi:MAG: glycosyl-4,4'-diaponeurosporenoate acyltransferase CrtO family protein [Planctomycetota bacterium]